MSTSDPEEAETAIEMVRGAVHDEDDHSLVLIFDGRYGQLGPWGEDAKLIRIPGTCSGRLQLKKVWIVEVGSSPAKLKTPAETPLRVTKPPRSPADQRAASFVMRVSADWHYANSWDIIARRPAQCFRTWALGHGVKPMSILDSWNFQQEGTSALRVSFG